MGANSAEVNKTTTTATTVSTHTKSASFLSINAQAVKELTKDIVGEIRAVY